MTTLLTGATGFLGGNIARALVARGDRVRVLTRPTSDVGELKELDVEIVTGDVTDRASVAAAAVGCRRVFHSAALVKTWLPDRLQFKRVNVDGTRNVIEAALEAGAERVVYTSTFLVLKPSDEPIVASSRADENEVWTDYARTKRTAQQLVDELVGEGAPIESVFPGVIYGPGKLTAGNLIADWIIRFARGKFPGFLGGGHKRWSFSFVDDVVAGHLSAGDKGTPGGCYCLGGENVGIREFMTLVAQTMDRKPPRLSVPFWGAKCVGLMQEAWARATGREPELTRAVVNTFRNNWALDSGPAEEELGYQVTPISDGVKQTVDWLRSEGVID